jgi:acyl-CoA thioester hydrolase
VSTELGKPYSGAFVGATHHFALRVYIEDTDLGGVVYYANYLRFLERARSDLLRSLGIDQRAAIENNAGVYAVAELHIQYLRPARLDDELIVRSEFEQIRGASAVLHQEIVRGGVPLVTALVTLAFIKFVNNDARPSRQPAEWVAKFKKLKSDAS